MTITTHYSGELAYLDTFSGLIPCKVICIDDNLITIKLTTNRKAYKRGEILTILSPQFHRVIPRSNIYQRNGQFRIRNNFQWKNKEE